MSRFEFDCFVCDERLETGDIKQVIEFGNRHKDCDFDADTATRPTPEGDPR